MFKSAELPISISKSDYKQKLEELRTELYGMQQKIIKAKIPVLIIIDGVPGSGRGYLVNLLNELMDSRTIRNRTFWMQTDDEKNRPEYWKYWKVLPAKGQIGIFFGGWYDIVNKFLEKDSFDEKLEYKANKINSFEKLLTNDGMLFIKLWLHKTKENYNKYKSDPFTKQHKKTPYNDIIKWYSKTIRLTNTPNSRWYIINANDANNRDITSIQTILSCMNAAINAKNAKKDDILVPDIEQQHYILDSIELNQEIDDKEYKEHLKKYKKKLYDLTLEAYHKGISTVILFEGWDAAGKGGAIRRVTSAIDARIRQTIQIAAPTEEEKLYHYLWRFWRNIPLKGFVTIYDRSWYGRVLVERVEKFATETEWSRSYTEINSFEEQLVEADIVLLKFWLHISQDEQLKRFKEREEIEWKQHKITDEDWRNRDKAPQYMAAINDMFINTSTDISKWNIIPANNKKYARILILQTICETLEKKLK